MTRFLKAMTLGFVLAAAGATPAWWRYVSPRVYRTATSPDGSWSVTVFRQRNHAYPLMEGVDVSVVVTGDEGRTLLKKTIDNRDLWEDVEVQYRDIICNNDEILIGPEYWNGEQLTYYRITKRDIQ